MRKYLTAVSLLIILFSCHSSNKLTKDNLVFSKANISAIIPHGRTIYDTSGGLVLIGAASYAEFTFIGDTCTIFLKNSSYPGDYNYVAIEVDNKYIGRLKIDGDSSKPFTIGSKDKLPRHHLRIYKATESQNGMVTLTGIKSAGIERISTQTVKKIEFIGNSITAGMGNDTNDIPCGTGKWYDQHNAYYSYAARVARSLNADFMLSAVSGIGIYRNWNSPAPAMPQVYESAYLQTDSSPRWDFKSFTPDIVSIALGTNDFSDGDGKSQRLPFDSAAFINTYVSFIGTIYKHYPDTRIALLTSPMLNGPKRDLHFTCLQSIKKKITVLFPDKQSIEIFQFQPMVPKGCSYHPSLSDHEKLANEVRPFLERLLRH